VTDLNVAGLLQAPPGTSRDLRLRDHYVTLGPDLELAGPLDADLVLQRTNRGILVRGMVRAPLRRTCARCTDPFVDEVAVAIDEEFLPSVDLASGAPIGRDAGESETANRINEHHEIELAPIFHDELSLTEPMHPLCRPDCAGLCPACGGKLDVGVHEHSGDDIDPRLAALGALLSDGDADGR